MKRFKTLPYLLIAIALVSMLAVRIYDAQKDMLNRAEKDCANGRAILLNSRTTTQPFTALLTSRGYITSEEEAAFISEHLMRKIKSKDGGQPKSLKDLSDDRYRLELDSAGFASIESFPTLGPRAEQLAGGDGIDPSKTLEHSDTSVKFRVKIREKEGGLIKDTIYICVKEHYDELVEIDGKVIDCHSRDSVLAWIPVCGKTDIWLPTKSSVGTDRYFSVIPVQRGFNFGSPLGTYHTSKIFRKLKFVRSRAFLPLLSRQTLKQVREDNSILVRSPQEYKDKFISSIALFAALWILAFLILATVDKKRGRLSNLGILAVAALLSGIGLVNLFNLQNPLWGELLAWSQLVKGIMIGVVMLVMFAIVDWVGLFRLSHKTHLASGKRWSQGLWMPVSAILIALILLLFGYGPGGTHVTLPLIPIQGSPIIKILLLGYLAVFFACRADLIEAYTRPGKFWKQMTVLFTAIVVLFVLGLLQLSISDLGPFLVIAITAMFTFSLATKETISMLIGTFIFGAMLLLLNHLGNRISGYAILPYALFAGYAVVCALVSYYRNSRVKVSPIIMGLAVLLSFYGGTIFKLLGMSDIAERLNGRTEIAGNIFDNEVIGGSQIAEGIWALARGGIFGKPETGLAATIPAGHTDLAFESLVENLGVFGGLAVLVCIGILLFQALRLGIRNGHPFAFAMASLVALSMSIQSVLIVAGSLGILPITGVVLPLTSYGGTALAIDLASLGILISLSRQKDYELECQNTQKYESMSKGQIWAYLAFAVISLATVCNYAAINRKHFLTEPGRFVNREGERDIVYNPVIDATKEQLLPGDILDCKGNVLATTDEDGSRVYPYGEYTLMMIGNLNTKVMWGSTGNRSAGLLAEERYMSSLRGYETHPVDTILTARRHYSKYSPDIPINKEETKKIHDYSALLPMMLSQKEIQEWNSRKVQRDIQLTVDAELQKTLSIRASTFVQSLTSASDRTRVSIVIIDASDGSLLTSAMYPLPNEKKLKELAITNTTIYRDWAKGFRAYTDMDLGLHPLAPGSAIKPISAGAGLKRFSIELAGPAFNQFVYNDEIIDTALGEPYGSVSLLRAIVGSSNIYFIKLTSRYGENGLYPELAELYYAIGANFGSTVPYVLFPDQTITGEKAYRSKVEAFGKNAADKYSKYEESGTRHRLIDSEYQPSWGQGEVSLSPIALCRYVAAVANDGIMAYPRYVATDSARVFKRLMSPEEAHILQDCMKAQAAGRFGEISSHIGGKTGTPNRTDLSKGKRGKSNDALYCFYVDGNETTSGKPLAVVVRLERVNDFSRIAVKMSNDVVIPVLREHGYIL